MIKFIYRFIKHLAILLCISIPLQIIGIIILPLCVIVYNIGKLPRCLRWFDSADPFIDRNTEVIERINRGGWLYEEPTQPVSFWKTCLNKYIWLAFRNPQNYFGYCVLGFQIKEIGPVNYYIISPSIIAQMTDSIDIGDNTGAYPGLMYSEMQINGKVYYEYVYIKPYIFRGEKKCLRVRIGYKLSNPYKQKLGEYTQQVFVISPFHSYNGK